MILAVNTSTLQFGLALLNGGEGTLLAEHVMAGDARHFGGVLPALDRLLASLKAAPRDLEAVIVAKGPGSFTGLRVGFSAAKGLSCGLGIPMIGVSSLEAMASQLPCPAESLGPILTSRRGEVFAAKFVWAEGRLVRKAEDVSLKFDELASFFDQNTWFIGNDLPAQGPALKGAFGEGVRLAPAHLWNLRASAVGFLGLRRFLERRFDDPLDLSPIYLRPPDIRPNPYPLLSGRLLSRPPSS